MSDNSAQQKDEIFLLESIISDKMKIIENIPNYKILMEIISDIDEPKMKFHLIVTLNEEYPGKQPTFELNEINNYLDSSKIEDLKSNLSSLCEEYINMPMLYQMYEYILTFANEEEEKIIKEKNNKEILQQKVRWEEKEKQKAYIIEENEKDKEQIENKIEDNKEEKNEINKESPKENNENKTNIIKKILILSKIKHKPILFNYIFSFVENRPIIFPYLIDKDPILKQSLKNTIETMNKRNTLSVDLNDNIYRFIFYRLLYEIDPNYLFLEKVENFYEKKIGELLFNGHNHYKELIIECLKEKYKASNINVGLNYILEYCNNEKVIKNYYIEYLYLQKQIILFHLPKDLTYIDSYYLYNLSRNKINQNIGLICTLSKLDFFNNPMTIEYEKINKLYFCLDIRTYTCNIFHKIYKYLIEIKHKEHIEEIYFDKYLSYYLNEIIEDYYEFTQNFSNLVLDFNFNSIKRIEFDDENISGNIKRYKIRYNISKIFGFNDCNKIMIINYKEFENIDSNKKDLIKLERKLNSLINQTTTLKILFINFEKNSPFQTCFYNFCNKYLKNNTNINLLVIDNIGNDNYDKECFNKVKDSNLKLKLPNLNQIFYEDHFDDKISKNTMKEILTSYFYFENFYIYEGFDDNNNLIYFNATSKKIKENKVKNIILKENKIYSFNLIYELIQIKYKRKEKHLIIKNNTINSKFDNNTPIKFFSEIIDNLKDLKKLTINGFNYKFSEIINKNISILCINSLNEFSAKNCNNNDLDKDDDNSENSNILRLFKNLQYLIISGNMKLLKLIIRNIKITKLKKIKFYTKDYDEKVVINIQKKLKKRNVDLIIIQLNDKNIQFEEEKEEEEYLDKDIYNKNNTNEIKETKFLFKSRILIRDKYLVSIIKRFTLFFKENVVKPNNFKLVYRASIFNDKIDEIWKIFLKNKESNLFLVIETKEGNVFGAVIFSGDIFKPRGFIYDYSNNNLSLDKIVIYKGDNKIKFGKYFHLSNEFLEKFSFVTIKNLTFTCENVEIFSFSGLQN